MGIFERLLYVFLATIVVGGYVLILITGLIRLKYQRKWSAKKQHFIDMKTKSEIIQDAYVTFVMSLPFGMYIKF